MKKPGQTPIAHSEIWLAVGRKLPRRLIVWYAVGFFFGCISADAPVGEAAIDSIPLSALLALLESSLELAGRYLRKDYH